LSNEIENEFQFVAKGHNETYEVVNPMEYARFLTVVICGHVSENGGTCSWRFPILQQCEQKQENQPRIYALALLVHAACFEGSLSEWPFGSFGTFVSDVEFMIIL
jgi:hypothetical protein